MTEPFIATGDQPPEKAAGRKTVHVLALLAAGVVLGVWLAYTPPGFAGKADAIGYAVCHQIAERSFSFYGAVSPMCARCTGMYLGVLVSALFYWQRRKRGAALFPPWKINAFLIAFAILWGLDGFNSYLHLFPNAPHVFPPSNTNRMLTGSLMGVNLMTLLLVGFNQVAWRDTREEPVLATLAELAALVLFVLGMDLLVLLELPPVLLAASALSVLMVLYLLTHVYAMALILLAKRENRYTSWWSLRFMLLAGFTLALVQIGGLDVARYALTGTWTGGFGF